jgi:hypothetical protein
MENENEWGVPAGASLTMIDRHYGHLARDGCEHAIKLLDALNASEFAPWTPVDARWTSKEPAAVSLKTKALTEHGES